MIRIPRAAPKMKPSVRSSAPIRLSMIMSAMRMVMKEITMCAIRNMAAAEAMMANFSSAMTVVSSSRVTSLPKRPFQVGPAASLP